MNTPKLTAALIALAIVGATSSAFADRLLYPEGSIFREPPVVAKPAPTTPQEARLSPLNPLDQPAAEGAWKPSNRDAGNFAEQRWQAYIDQRNAAQNASK